MSMSVRMFVSLLYAISIISCCIIAKNVYATDYTTSYSDNSHSASTSNTAGAKINCTKKDISRIKKFNNKAQYYLDKHKAYLKSFKKATLSETNIKKLIKENEESMAFFMSDDYFRMKDIYDRCDMKIPAISFGEMFWMTDEMLGRNQGCSSCK